MIVVGIVFGWLLSLYALWIYHKKSQDPSYKALCDISKKASCSRTFSHPYSRIFYLPNPFWGILFYAVLGVFYSLQAYAWFFYGIIWACMVSLFLAYLLFKIRNFCIVCFLIYSVNFYLLLAFVLWA